MKLDARANYFFLQNKVRYKLFHLYAEIHFCLYLCRQSLQNRNLYQDLRSRLSDKSITIESENTDQQSHLRRINYSAGNYLRRYWYLATLCFKCHNQGQGDHRETDTWSFILYYLDTDTPNYHQIRHPYTKSR